MILSLNFENEKIETDNPKNCCKTNINQQKTKSSQPAKRLNYEVCRTGLNK